MPDMLQIHHVAIDKLRLRINPEDILQLLGEQTGVEDKHTKEIVEQYIEKGLQLSSPEGAFILKDALGSESMEDIHIPGITFKTGKIIPRMLRNAEYFALFLVTAGPEPENQARTLLNEGNYLEGYILDLVASALVDLAAGQVQEQVRTLAEGRGIRITNRYSPGYCSWNVDEQQKLFSLFPEGCCGISLSESSLMDPIKSISGIIGMGSGVKYQDYTCEICSQLDCQFRRTRYQ